MTNIFPTSKKYKTLMTDHVNEMCLVEGYDLADRKFILDAAGDRCGKYRGYIEVNGKLRGPYEFNADDLAEL